MEIRRTDCRRAPPLRTTSRSIPCASILTKSTGLSIQRSTCSSGSLHTLRTSAMRSHQEPKLWLPLHRRRPWWTSMRDEQPAAPLTFKLWAPPESGATLRRAAPPESIRVAEAGRGAMAMGKMIPREWCCPRGSCWSKTCCRGARRLIAREYLSMRGSHDTKNASAWSGRSSRSSVFLSEDPTSMNTLFTACGIGSLPSMSVAT